jgi:CopG family transcriptional regulator/antitoxin EndoAI
MLSARKIMITLAESLLSEVDEVKREECKNRSQLINEALCSYLGERNRQRVRYQLAQGYVEMAEINLLMSGEAWGEE